jgi:hypothetical protein
MEKELTVLLENVQGEEGLTRACKEGKLFRNNPGLEDLYREGFRIYNYDVVGEEEDEHHHYHTTVKVFLKK